MRTTVLAAFVLAFVLLCLPRPVRAAAEPPASETARLARLLAEVDASCYGLRIRRPDSRLDAMERLGEIGTPAAVRELYGFLVRPDAGALLKMHALLALARIGSTEAAQAIGKFEQWAEDNRKTPPPFTFGPKAFATFHYNPIDVRPASTATGPGETTWALFQWDKFGRRSDPGGTADWWITKSLDGIRWDQPLLVEGVGKDVPSGADQAEHFLTDIRLGRTKLDPFTLDSDGDGLTDLLESRVGTDPKVADSDHDGVPDGKDGNPLTPAGQVSGDEAEIRQAVFTFVYATEGSEYPIYMVDKGEFARQEYLGHRGVVLPAPKTRLGRVNVISFTVTMESATSAKASVMDVEGAEAGAEQRLSLRKLHGRWVVAERELGIVM